ncbi:MAG: hypothetical protein IKX00_03440 [Bacilli bacterium]|nr:hypothetical protein [Bacilli bacterium]
MHNLEEGLKAYITDLIYEDDIKNIILLLREQFELQKYIDLNNPVDFNFEEFHGVSFENPIDYSEYNRQITVNMSVLRSKFTKTFDPSTQPYNWMVLLYEIFYIIEDIKIIKYTEENIKNNVTKIIKLYEDFKANKVSALEIKKYIDGYKKDEITSCEIIEDPVERIRKVHAYFNTLNVFKKIHLNDYYMNQFKLNYNAELLNGYQINNQNVYPLRNVFFQNSYIDGTLFMNNFAWFKNESMVSLSNATSEVNSLEERLALGYPIESIEYNLVRKNKI